MTQNPTRSPSIEACCRQLPEHLNALLASGGFKRTAAYADFRRRAEAEALSQPPDWHAIHTLLMDALKELAENPCDAWS